jgi:hypothetical protein
LKPKEKTLSFLTDKSVHHLKGRVVYVFAKHPLRHRGGALLVLLLSGRSPKDIGAKAFVQHPLALSRPQMLDHLALLSMSVTFTCTGFVVFQ